MKSQLYQAVRIILLLLVSLQPAWALFDCGAYDRLSKEKLQRCADVLEVFENALVSSKVNIHVLKGVFLSQSSPTPSLLGVIYEVNKIDHTEVHWSSSRVFTMIDPTMIHALQPGLMTLIYYLEGISFLQQIKLYLDVPNYEDFSESEIDYAIVEITERLRAYAVHQKAPTDWDERNKGFVIVSASRSLSKKLVIYALIPTTTVLLFIVLMAFSFKMVTNLSTLDQSSQAHVKISLFWSLMSVLSVTNILEVLLQVILVIIGSSSYEISFKTNKNIHIFKIVFSGIIIFIGICVGDCCNKKLPPNSNKRHLCGPPDPKMNHGFAICNIFQLVFFTSTSFIITAALLFVYPVLVLSTVTYLCTAIFCAAAMLALPTSFDMIFDKFEKQRNVNELRRNSAYLWDYLLYVIAFIVASLLMLLFLIMMSNADNTHPTGIFQDAFSFLPSAILGVTGYFAKKKLAAKNKKGKRLEEDKQELQDKPRCKRRQAMNSLEDAEGRARVHSPDHEEMEKLLPNKEETQL